MEQTPENIKLLKRRLKYKGFGYHLGAMLHYVEPDGALSKHYQNVMHCGDQLYMKPEQYFMSDHFDAPEVYRPAHLSTLKPCKGRECPYCNRVRTGVLMNAYLPRLQEIAAEGSLWFLTLTMRNVPGEKLKEELKRYRAIWAKIRKMKKFERYIKEGGVIGIRKTECTYHYNAFLVDLQPQWVEDKDGKKHKEMKFAGWKRDADDCPIADPWWDTYHPHFHFLCNSKEFCEWLMAMWLELCGDDADKQAQDLRQVYDDTLDLPWKERAGKKGVREIFKYFTKLVTHLSDGRWWIDAPSLNTIFKAMSGSRVFQRFGTTENWECEEVAEDAYEEEPLEIEEGSVFDFLETGFWGNGTWQYIEHYSHEVLVSMPRRGGLAEMLRDSEGDSVITTNKDRENADSKETRQEVEGSVHRLQERSDEGRDCLDPARAGASGTDARRCEGSTRCRTALGSELHAAASEEGQTRHTAADVRGCQERGGDRPGGGGSPPEGCAVPVPDSS